MMTLDSEMVRPSILATGTAPDGETFLNQDGLSP